MESRIAKKVDQHLSGFKDQIKEWFNENDSDICGECSKNDFLQFIFDYNSLSLSKDDFSRRKRIKNTVPLGIRCCAPFNLSSTSNQSFTKFIRSSLDVINL